LPSEGFNIRINISKERKVLNHLNEKHENTNLLFYNFNAYGETGGQSELAQ